MLEVAEVNKLVLQLLKFALVRDQIDLVHNQNRRNIVSVQLLLLVGQLVVSAVKTLLTKRPVFDRVHHLAVRRIHLSLT